MNTNLRTTRAARLQAEEPNTARGRFTSSDQRSRVSELIVAYFIRGIRSLDAGQRGPALATRRVWNATPQLGDGRPKHPWSN